MHTPRTIVSDIGFGGKPPTTATARTASDWMPLERNTLRGFFPLQLRSGLVLNDCTLHEKGDRRWVGLPGKPQIDSDGRQRVDATGKKLWTPAVEVPGKEPQSRFQRAALAAVGRSEFVHPRARESRFWQWTVLRDKSRFCLESHIKPHVETDVLSAHLPTFV